MDLLQTWKIIQTHSLNFIIFIGFFAQLLIPCFTEHTLVEKCLTSNSVRRCHLTENVIQGFHLICRPHSRKKHDDPPSLIPLKYSMSFLSNLRGFVDCLPGRKTFGFYRFLPFFFCLGAGLEFTMIKWTPNGTNFYNTYKKSLAATLVDRKEFEAKKETENKTQS